MVDPCLRSATVSPPPLKGIGDDETAVLPQSLTAELERMMTDARYPELIKALRELVREDRRVFTHSIVKIWCGLRWRHLFLMRAVQDPAALAAATRPGRLMFKDRRPDRQKIAERFLASQYRQEWCLDQPAFQNASSPKRTALVFAPGILCGMTPVHAFESQMPQVARELKIRVIRADSHPMRGCAANSPDLLQAIDHGQGFTANMQPITARSARAPERVVIIGYSKGSADVLELLANRPELENRITCVFNWAGVISGSVLADALYAGIRHIHFNGREDKLKSFLGRTFPFVTIKGPLRRLAEFDIRQAVYDITTQARCTFLTHHLETLKQLAIPFFDIDGVTSLGQIPYFHAHAYLALKWRSAANDMMIAQKDARLPIAMATHLATLKAHHWDLGFDPFPMSLRFGSRNLDHPFPRKAALFAMLQLAIELGLVD